MTTKAYQLKLLRHIRKKERQLGGGLIKKQGSRWVLREGAEQYVSTQALEDLNAKPET